MKAAAEAIDYTDHLRKMRQVNLNKDAREQINIADVVVWNDQPKTFSVFQQEPLDKPVRPVNKNPWDEERKSSPMKPIIKEKKSSAKKQKVNFYIPPEEAEDLEESKMRIPEDNKLAGLNEMLKKRQFVI